MNYVYGAIESFVADFYPTDKHWMTFVHRSHMMSYTKWVNKRLPLEAERKCVAREVRE